MNTPSFETLIGVVTKTWNIKCLNASCQIAIERSLQSIFEIVNHDLLDESIYGVFPLFKVLLLRKTVVEQLAECFI